MRATGLLPLLGGLALVVALVAGCTGDEWAADEEGGEASSATETQEPAPRLGGPSPRHRIPPTQDMDRLERPVAARLSRRIAAQGLTLQYLDCPRWDGAVPSRMTCRGYVDGLVATVHVDVTGGSHHSVAFDARVTGGMVATERLEHSLLRTGSTHADCGRVAAYPARPGSRIVCRVTRAGRHRYVVATVTDRSGEVRIAGYHARAER